MPLVLGHTHEAIQPATYSQMIQEKNYRKIEKNGGGGAVKARFGSSKAGDQTCTIASDNAGS